MIPDNKRVIDILKDLDDIAVVSFIGPDIGHAYIGKEDIDNIPLDLLERKVEECLIVKKVGGFYVELEV